MARMLAVLFGSLIASVLVTQIAATIATRAVAEVPYPHDINTSTTNLIWTLSLTMMATILVHKQRLVAALVFGVSIFWNNAAQSNYTEFVEIFDLNDSEKLMLTGSPIIPMLLCVASYFYKKNEANKAHFWKTGTPS